MIGKRLLLARQAAGLSLRALAERLDGMVTAQAIQKYEKDRAMPGSQVLLALSRTLGVTPDYLLSEREIQVSGLEFRKAPSAGAKEESAVQARVLEHLERYLAVEEALQLSSLHWNNPLQESDPISEPAAAEEAAKQLRIKWKLGNDPIPSMTELMEEHAIKVIALELDRSVFGSKLEARLAGGELIPAVLVNSLHKGERQRFTLAHELGHLALSLAKQLEHKQQERMIDRFAGAFLVPADELRRAVGNHRNDVSLGELLELKSRFLVSLQTIVVRLNQAAVLADADTRRHWNLLKEKGYLDLPWDEPQPVSPESSHRLHRLAMRAVTEGALSESRAADLLNITVRELNRWLDEGAHADAA